MPNGPPPLCLKPQLDSFPSAFTRERIWIVWRWEKQRDRRSGKERWAKVPLIPCANGARAASDNRATWRSFACARRAFEHGKGDGIGIMRTGRFLFLDLDGCFAENGSWRDWPYPGPTPFAITEALSDTAWGEVSPSGTGAHLITSLCELLPPGPREFDFAPHRGVSFYDGPRFLALTGDALFLTAPEPGEPPAAVLRELWQALVRAKVSCSKKSSPRCAKNGWLEPRPQPAPRVLGDMLADPTLAALYSGNWDGLYPSQSEADLAFCRKLRWRGFDPNQVDVIIRSSGLMREKWDREDYRSRTLKLAFGL